MTGKTEIVLLATDGNNVGIDPQTDQEVHDLESIGQDLIINRNRLAEMVEIAFQDEDSDERETLAQLSQRVQEDNKHFSGKRGLALAKGRQTVPQGVPLHQAEKMGTF